MVCCRATDFLFSGKQCQNTTIVRGQSNDSHHSPPHVISLTISWAEVPKSADTMQACLLLVGVRPDGLSSSTYKTWDWLRSHFWFKLVPTCGCGHRRTLFSLGGGGYGALMSESLWLFDCKTALAQCPLPPSTQTAPQSPWTSTVDHTPGVSAVLGICAVCEYFLF